MFIGFVIFQSIRLYFILILFFRKSFFFLIRDIKDICPDVTEGCDELGEEVEERECIIRIHFVREYVCLIKGKNIKLKLEKIHELKEQSK